MTSPGPPSAKSVFLARSGYRQRRLRDALRMLPVVGVVLWLFPLLWRSPDSESPLGQVLIYVFGVWLLLIVAAGVMARALRPDEAAGTGDGRD